MKSGGNLVPHSYSDSLAVEEEWSTCKRRSISLCDSSKALLIRSNFEGRFLGLYCGFLPISRGRAVIVASIGELNERCLSYTLTDKTSEVPLSSFKVAPSFLGFRYADTNQNAGRTYCQEPGIGLIGGEPIRHRNN